MLKKIILFFFIVSFISLTFSQDIVSRPKLTFSVAGPLDLPVVQLTETIYSTVFDKLGYDFVYEVYPPARGVIEINAGRVDGTSGRFKEEFSNINKKYPNIMFGSEPILEINIVVVILEENKKDFNWDEILNSEYNIGYSRGYKIIEDNLLNINDTKRIIIADKEEQLFRLLVTKRIKVMIILEDVAISMLNQPEFKNSNIIIGNILHTTGLYPGMNISHKELLNKFDAKLVEMKISGEFQDIFANFKPSSSED